MSAVLAHPLLLAELPRLHAVLASRTATPTAEDLLLVGLLLVDLLLVDLAAGGLPQEALLSLLSDLLI